MDLQKTKNKIKQLSLMTNDEISGFVIKKENDFIVIPCKNVSSKPKIHFLIDPIAYLYISLLGNIEFLFHSHLEGSEFSDFDKLNLYNNKLRGLLYCKKEDVFNIFSPESYNKLNGNFN